MCYGTYEFTNYATLKAWSPAQVIADTLWGAACSPALPLGRGGWRSRGW